MLSDKGFGVAFRCFDGKLHAASPGRVADQLRAPVLAGVRHEEVLTARS
ncbi:hypothetical protein [Nocardia cyriacigeorgica]|nr:hypothetical protein [Nocardia cyriacigeorgica]MBF6454979.1 hypothetical protein [Nocardia cyriacigeorgica]MBF6480928.1 hypothetical protein [Nocardia cyriacigeorgica]MBF6552874.1 hypothetical protein [Nocardia cyriacigeorgica]